MSAATNNDEAAVPNRDLIASLLPTAKPPAALSVPGAYSKQNTARLVLSKLFSLCMLVGVLGSERAGDDAHVWNFKHPCRLCRHRSLWPEINSRMQSC